MEEAIGMWCRSVTVNPAKEEAWWAAAGSCLVCMAEGLGHALETGVFVARRELTPSKELDVAQLFDFDESPSTGVYASLDGDARGLLLLTCDLPASTAVRLASNVFGKVAYLVGGLLDEPWALIDMRSTLAESLAAQTGWVDLKVLAKADFVTKSGKEVASLVFIPDYSSWNARWNIEAEDIAA